MSAMIFAIFSSLLLAAHFLRDANWSWLLISLLFPLFLSFKRRWAHQLLAIFYLLMAFEWLNTALAIYEIRVITGEAWLRMALILGVVALFTLWTALLIFRQIFKGNIAETWPGADTTALWVFLLTFALLSIVRQNITSITMLLFDRLAPGFGWLQILALSLYGAVIAEKMMQPKNVQATRLLIWKIFSIVFFVQLALGLWVSDTFLMTGKLHIPVPAIILAGPLYRGEGLFMPILFLSTILLVGPAWCSHLCYFGAWDNFAANRVCKPRSIRRWAEPLRIAILLLVVTTAIGLGLAGVSALPAAALAIAFGALGVAIMIFISRKKGIMVHCTVYCPIGLFSVLLGKINPFRIKISDACTDCNACSRVCRFDALNLANIQKRSAGYTCTLCGDCISSCHHGALQYGFFKMQPQNARMLFLILIITLHAIFMGLARI
ncbi:MAG TPA: 4Fe-4S binding protein [Candidatus Marinimicrobia bacterium]|nr:4Fe-4S binding protein [Candidatus Neomarinimicrobiota bacterium]